MTRLAVLSDIHSNLPALEAVLTDIRRFDLDRIVVAGDAINWGPFSAEVMERLSAENCAAIRGNNELYLTDWQTPRAPDHWSQFTLPPFTIAQLGQHWINVIAAWPDTLSLRFRDAPALRVAHGTPRSPFEPLTPLSTDAQIAEMLAGVEESTVVLAHTHLPLDRQSGPWHILNAGSVGNPLEGNPGIASYMILESSDLGWTATLRRVAFDLVRLLEHFKTTHFVEQTGVVGQLVVDEYRSGRPEVYPFLQWVRTCHPDLVPNQALLEQFAAVNKWDYMPPYYVINR